MALIDCEECGHKVFDKARSCPYMIIKAWFVSTCLLATAGLSIIPIQAWAHSEQYGVMLQVSDVDRSSQFYGQGVKVIAVAPGSPLAKNLGIPVGDILFNVNGITVHNVAELRCLLTAAKHGYTLYFIQMESWKAPGGNPDFRAMRRCAQNWDAEHRGKTIAEISWKSEKLNIMGPVTFQERPPMPEELQQQGVGASMITDQTLCNYAWHEGYKVVRIVSPGTRETLEHVAHDAANRLSTDLTDHDYSWASTPSAGKQSILHNFYLDYLYIAWQYDHVPINALNHGNFTQLFACAPNKK